MCDDNNVEKLNKQPNFYAKRALIKFVFFTNKLMVLLVYKETYLNANKLDSLISSVVVSLLQKYDDLFLETILRGLSSIKRIKHHIDLILKALIPNPLTYRINLEEMKTLQRQVDKLMMKGYIRESINPVYVSVTCV